MASNKKFKSDIWQCFTKVNQNNVRCNECLKTFAYHNNTTNMWNHLMRKHPRNHAKMKENEVIIVDTINREMTDSQVNELPTGVSSSQSSRQSTIEESFQSITSNTKTKETKDEALIYFIIRQTLHYVL